jgi:hypothetical protein
MLGGSLFPRFLGGHVVTHCATNNCASNGMVSCDMPCHATDRSALETAFRIGASAEHAQEHDERRSEEFGLHGEILSRWRDGARTMPRDV